jgi:hypothetical protein
MKYYSTSKIYNLVQDVVESCPAITTPQHCSHRLAPCHRQGLPGCCQHRVAVTDLQGPPSERTPEEKLWDLKKRAQQYARDRESCDDVRISYLEFLETEAEDDLALARMIAG